MNYVQTYHIRNDRPSRTTTKRLVPTVEGVLSLDAKTQRRKRSTKRQTQVCPPGNVTNGFLKTTFLPRLKEGKTIQVCQTPPKMERDFYKSLSLLADHYRIEPIQTKQFDYPYSMALAMWDIKQKLKRYVLNWKEICLVQDRKKTYIVSEEKCTTDTTLYYIPVEPLYQMLHDPKRKKNAQLLISVCTYLYHIADIPYFRQEDSYLYWMYQRCKDWLEEDTETDDIEASEREFRKVALIGDCMEQKVSNRINLQVFERRLNHFKSRDTFDHDCWQMARDTFALYTEYPQASIFRNIPKKETDQYDYDEYETIGMEKYISFISHTKGWMYDSITEAINCEFNEYGVIEEPTICKQFDGKEVTKNNLDLENRLFPLLDDLCSLLYNYESTRK